MKVTVTELPAEMDALPDAWDALVSHVRGEGSDLVLLPEMPFSPWLAATAQVDPRRWVESVADHGRWVERIGELQASVVLGTRPAVTRGTRYNEGFVWEGGECRGSHLKYYLPDEDGFWEATWYRRGDGDFSVEETGSATIGFLICTEMWFTRHARDLGRQGAGLIASPRATEWSSRDKWLAGGRAAAVMAGAFGLSSNRSGPDASGIRWGGLGWVIDPDGEVLATTSEGTPFATVDIDLAVAEAARLTYPRYVED